MTPSNEKKVTRLILLILTLLAAGCSPAPGVDSEEDLSLSAEGRVNPAWYGHMPSQWIASGYFDRGMNYTGSRFRVVDMTALVRALNPDDRWDAVLLECHDDYQGIVSVADIVQYRLQLALAMELPEGLKKPDWLNPMVIIVPDGSRAPRQERFMTANIRDLRFVRLSEYYAPLDAVTTKSVKTVLGAEVFKDNCLFCHSLKGIGGSKGTDLMAAYDFTPRVDGPRFKKDFAAFHNEMNLDKQNMEQFVDSKALKNIVIFLREVQRSM